MSFAEPIGLNRKSERSRGICGSTFPDANLEDLTRGEVQQVGGSVHSLVVSRHEFVRTGSGAMGGAHAACDKECLHGRFDVGLVLTRNVEGGAMRRRCDWDRQAALDRHSPFKS